MHFLASVDVVDCAEFVYFLAFEVGQVLLVLVDAIVGGHGELLVLGFCAFCVSIIGGGETGSFIASRCHSHILRRFVLFVP